MAAGARRSSGLIGVGGAGLAFLLAVAPEADATPTYAVRSVAACDTCHIEPSGWANPELKDRQCSLDCSTCHVSPTGGGMRNPSGAFYGLEAVPTWGPRPSDSADHMKYLPDGHPTEGRYRIGKGFEGWWPGETPAQQIADRYGPLDPDPAFAVGADARFMSYTLLGDEGYTKAFPMQAELYLMGRPKRGKTVLYADIGLHSDADGLNILGTDIEGAPEGLEYFRVRELFAMVDELPYNSYARAGRFNPPHGWRIPDHTSFTRRALGFDQDHQVFGVEGGINPNYPYANVALYRQGLDAWPGDTGDPGWGVSMTAGKRELAWHAGGSVTAVAYDEDDNELIFGPLYALNLYPVVVLGELDLRQVYGEQLDTGLYGLQVVEVLVVQGVNAKAKFDFRDPILGSSDRDKTTTRYTVGASWSPVRHLDLEFQYLRQLDDGELFGHDVIVMAHGWY